MWRYSQSGNVGHVKAGKDRSYIHEPLHLGPPHGPPCCPTKIVLADRCAARTQQNKILSDCTGNARRHGSGITDAPPPGHNDIALSWQCLAGPRTQIVV
ncbi:protein of unknown function [Micropruina glycogenica]|uniref:Uncharacterized protein n=1 Tax=Micropruina glycogenica TaxID=75385 RepID=A0A2N9JK55_9ACTN|nr:protein of unknown function [Micropruina glycogenica]